MVVSTLLRFTVLVGGILFMCESTLGIDASIMDKAFDKYTDSCPCGKSYGSAGGNCAHYASNALIKGGLKEIDGGIGGEFREVHGMVVCKHGREVRAKELRDWFKNHGKRVSSPPSDKTVLVYQKRPSDGQDHVLLRKGNKWHGTGNYPGWQIQEYYTL